MLNSDLKTIRLLIREVVEEALLSNHYIERVYDRFLNKEFLNVGFESDNSKDDYEIVGNYKITNKEKEIIKNNCKKIENYDFPTKKEYGIKIYSFNINNDNVDFFNEEDKEKSENKNLIFIDNKTKSFGNEIYAIVRENYITTIYFAKNYIVQNKEKLRVDYLIKNISSLDNDGENKKEGSRKKVEINLPNVIIKGKKWYVDEENELLIYAKNTKKTVDFNELTEEEFSIIIDSI